MKASELRIGNLCYYHVDDPIEGEYDVLNTIDYEDIRILFGECGEAFRPIIIDHDWLSKFGFVKEGLHYAMGVHQMLFSGLMKLTFNSSLQKWVFSIGRYKDITRLQYVHQLQNLYYALTNTELICRRD